MITICDITRRCVLPEAMCFTKGTRVSLKAYSDKDLDINLVVRLDGSLGTSEAEVDSIIKRTDITDPAGNKQQWEKVRQLVHHDWFTPNHAWLYVALQNAVRKWKFFMGDPVLASSVDGLYIHTPLKVMYAKFSTEASVTFFDNKEE